MIIVGKSFGFVDINIECKNILISANIGEYYHLSNRPNRDTKNIFVLAYPQLPTGSEICQSKT